MTKRTHCPECGAHLYITLMEARPETYQLTPDGELGDNIGRDSMYCRHDTLAVLECARCTWTDTVLTSEYV